MEGSDVEELLAVAGVYSKPMLVPGDVKMSKLTRLLRASLVVNVPVALPPSLNVTPDSVNMWFARTSTAQGHD